MGGRNTHIIHVDSNSFFKRLNSDLDDIRINKLNDQYGEFYYNLDELD